MTARDTRFDPETGATVPREPDTDHGRRLALTLLAERLEGAEDYFDQRADSVDGPDGTAPPNKEAHLLNDIRWVRGELERIARVMPADHSRELAEALRDCLSVIGRLPQGHSEKRVTAVNAALRALAKVKP